MLENANPRVFMSYFRGLMRSREFSILLMLITLTMLLAVFSERWFSFSNLENLLVQVSSIAVSAIGMTMIITTGGIDVSAGSILGMVAVTVAKVSTSGIGTSLSLLIGFLLGASLGLFNGLLIQRLVVPPIIATLGMMSLLRSLIYTVSGGKWISEVPEKVRWFGLGRIFDIAVPILVMGGLIVYFSYFMLSRPLGRYIYAVGNSQEAARVSGIPTDKILLFVYSLAGFLYALSALIVIGRTGLVQTNIGHGFELQVIAAVVLGGTSIMGGRGTVIGSLLGALLVVVIGNGLILTHIPALLEGLVVGALILGSVILDVARNRGE